MGNPLGCIQMIPGAIDSRIYILRSTEDRIHILFHSLQFTVHLPGTNTRVKLGSFVTHHFMFFLAESLILRDGVPEWW